MVLPDSLEEPSVNTTSAPFSMVKLLETPPFPNVTLPPETVFVPAKNLLFTNVLPLVCVNSPE